MLGLLVAVVAHLSSRLLVQAENMDNAKLLKVIDTGSFTGPPASVVPETKELGRASGAAVSSSPSHLRRHHELEAECARLREQLALTQQQLAKAAVSLAASRKDDKYTLRGKNNNRRNSDGPGRSWGMGKGKKEEAGAPPPPASGASAADKAAAEGEDLSSELLVSTTAQLEVERTRAAKLDTALRQLREATEKKMEERLNEMARRLNKANQSNEIRFKTMTTEYDNMKLQVVAAKKAYQRKAEDVEVASREQLKVVQDQLRRAVAYAQGVREEIEQARNLTATNEKLAADLLASSELQKRSVQAISKLREVLEEGKKERADSIKQCAEAEQRCAEAVAERDRAREESDKMKRETEELRQKLQVRESEAESARSEAETARAKAAELAIAKTLLERELETLRRQAAEVNTPPPSSVVMRKSPMPALGLSTAQTDRRSRAESPVAADEPLSFSALVGSSPRTRSSSLAEALGEMPPSRRRSGSISLPREEPVSFTDDIWKSWITDPYVYDAVSVLSNCVPDPRELMLNIKGHIFETGMANVAPMGDPSHLEFVGPLERILYYQKNLAHRDHVHFVGVSTAGEHMVVTIEAAIAINRSVPLLALVQMKKQSLRALVDMEKSAPPPPKTVLLDEFLSATYPGCNLKRVDNPSAHDLVSQRLIEFENMHLDFNRRVGILYWKSGQTENEAFGNNMSPELDEFLNFFGERIRLKGWNKFRGGLNVNRDETGEFSVYTEFQNFSFMAHVSALLPYRESDEQKLDRKRHIGNDLVVIIFWEGPGSFDASKIVTQMCHVFIVFERVPSSPDSNKPRYRVGVVCRSGVQPFKPYLPSPAVFDADEKLRTWLFMKIINGERATFQARTFLTKTSTARKTLLDKIARETLALLEGDPYSVTAPSFVYSRMVMREPLRRLRAVAAFQGAAPSHLSFKKGEEIILYCRPSSEWWNGGIGNRRGDFPASKVVEKERKEDKKEKRKWGKAQRSETSPSEVMQTKAGPTAAAPPVESNATHHIYYTIAKAVSLGTAVSPTATDLLIKTHVVSVHGNLEGSQRQTAKVPKSASPEWNESFNVKILDPMWEVLHVEVWEVEAGGAQRAVCATEIPCGELVVNCNEPAKEYAMEPIPEGKPVELAGTAVYVSVEKVVELQAPALHRSMTAMASMAE